MAFKIERRHLEKLAYTPTVLGVMLPDMTSGTNHTRMRVVTEWKRRLPRMRKNPIE